MNNERQNNENAQKPLHHNAGRKFGAGQSIYIKNAAHENSGNLNWVKKAFTKATLGTVRRLNQDA